jgi:mannose-6-phosphate isomerase-like protein (cupin superfamily)
MFAYDHRVAGYTIVNIKELEDMAIQFGMSPSMEARFGRSATDAQQGGFSYQRLAPNFRQPFGHRHRDQEEFYIVLSGSGSVTLESETRAIRTWDAIRVAPETARGFESGEDGLELLVFGAGEGGETEVLASFWDELPPAS